MTLDVIIPSYNEEKNIEPLFKELTKVLKDIKYNLIFVDDGSTDDTLKELKKIYKKDNDHVKVISFSRNFGKDAAIYAGMNESNANYLTIIDADLQQQPELILEMLKFLEENEEYDEVAMVNRYDKESKISKLFKHTFYRSMSKITKYDFHDGASDFRTMRKYVVKAIVSLQENNRFTKGLFAWAGFKVKYMEYNPNSRLNGKSKFSFKRQISYAIDGIVNFSTSPMKFALYLGTLISSCSFIYLIYLIIKTLVKGKDAPGFASIMCVMLLLGGIILIVQGATGEYVAKTYIESKNRPIYITKTKLGFDDDIL